MDSTTLKRYLTYAGAGAIVLLLAFAAGRYTVPTKVVTQEKVVTVEKQVIVEKVDEHRLDELTQQVKTALSRIEQLKKSIHRERTSVTHPDGSVEAKEVVDENIDRTVQTTQIKEVEKQVVVVQDRVVTVEKQVVVEKTVEKEKLVQTQKPQWVVGAMLGLDAKALHLGTALTSGPVSYGASLDRRLLGPVFVGAWGLSSGQGGLRLSVEF